MSPGSIMLYTIPSAELSEFPGSSRTPCRVPRLPPAWLTAVLRMAALAVLERVASVGAGAGGDFENDPGGDAAALAPATWLGSARKIWRHLIYQISQAKSGDFIAQKKGIQPTKPGNEMKFYEFL